MGKKQFIPALLYAVSLLTLSASGKSINLCEKKNVVDAEMIVQGYEWGPAVPKVIVKFNDIVTGVKKDTFTIKTGDAEREIIKVYNSDAFGNRRILPSRYLSFDLKVKTVYVPFVNSSFGEASPFVYDIETGINDWAETFNLELSLAENKSFNIGLCKQSNFETYTKNLMEDYVIPETAVWEKDTFTPSSGNFTLQRASFTPCGAKRDGVKNPLIIWLHGAGEGGSDVDITLLGNEVTALAKEGIQKYFTTNKQKGAYVLAVQTPTMWMDKGDGTYNSDIDGERQTSKYDASLFEAIQDYVKSNKDIDTNRIYIGGCSNGGYMTMNLMFEHGDFFTAFYPICEAYMNRNISDEMIDQVKDYNIWLIHSEDDTTVNPLETSIPSYYRLINAGAKNVHYTLFENVKGTDDPDAVYMGHYSWVYAFNDQVKKEFDNEKTLEDFENITIEKGKLTSTDNYVTNANCNKEGNMWTWLAKQTKNN